MSSSSLEVHRRPRPAQRSRWWRIAAVVGAILLVIGWLVWFLRTPEDLPVSSRTADGGGVVGQEVYVGMFAVGDGFDRSIEISEVEVDVDADADVEVTPKLCRDGSLGVTTDASGWCPELIDPEGEKLDDGDSIVLVVTADEPTEVRIGRLRISFRDGIRWGTKDAGLEGATLTFADHTPGTVPQETAEDTTTERPQGESPKDRKQKTPNRDRDAA